MKNISFICLLFCLTILGCDKEKSGTPKSGNDYYMFSITIDGVTHKVEGNINNYLYAPSSTENSCIAIFNTFNASISAGLADKGASSYISGEVFNFGLSFPNLSLGPNNATGSGVQANLNWPESECGISINALTANTFFYNGYSLGLSLDNVEITDLGSAGTLNPGNISNPYTFGDPVIGSFSGTVYGCSTASSGNNIPVQLEIEFVAPRLYN